MLRLRTGVPGAGKTAFTLEEFLVIQHRPKYATHIEGFDYQKHNVEKIESLSEWPNLPDGSVIFCDEAQQFLRPKRKDAVTPDWVTDFETHRHRGMDFYCTTQHPMFLDVHFRRLVGEHYHYHRAYGSRLVSRRIWNKCIDDPNDFHAMQEAEVKAVTLPKHIFSEYTSTTLDTHKFKIPRKLVISLIFIILMGSLAIYLFAGFASSSADKLAKNEQETTQKTEKNNPYSSIFSSDSQQDKPLTIEDMTPVLPTMPYTAPYYKDVAQPVTFPRFAGCMRAFHHTKGKEVCRCVTQQGTTLAVPIEQCDSVVDGDGMPFDPFRSDSNSQISRTLEEGGNKGAG